MSKISITIVLPVLSNTIDQPVFPVPSVIIAPTSTNTYIINTAYVLCFISILIIVILLIINYWKFFRKN